MPPNPNKFIPNLPEEEQDVMEMEPVVFGAGAYGSPDPRTNENRLLPAVDNPHEIGALAAQEAAEMRGRSGDYKSMKKSDLQAMAEEREIDGAADMKKDELVDALEQDDMDSMSKEDLMEQARGLEIEGASKMDKEELFYAVRDAEAEQGGAGGSGENRTNVARQTTGVPAARPIETAPSAAPPGAEDES